MKQVTRKRELVKDKRVKRERLFNLTDNDGECDLHQVQYVGGLTVMSSNEIEG